MFAGEVTIFCTGPLTNIALAIRLYPEFVRDVRQMYILGGSVYSEYYKIYVFISYYATGMKKRNQRLGWVAKLMLNIFWLGSGPSINKKVPNQQFHTRA